MKVCSKCGVKKPLFAYSIHDVRGGKVYKRRDCKKCAAARNAFWRTTHKQYLKCVQALWRRANKTHVKVMHAAWYLANKDKEKIRGAKRYELNKIKENARRAAWNKLNPEKIRAHAARRRALKLNVTPHDANPFFISEIYALAALRTKMKAGGIAVWHVDHIVPLSKGGLHHEKNLRVIPGAENLRKGSRLLT